MFSIDSYGCMYETNIFAYGDLNSSFMSIVGPIDDSKRIFYLKISQRGMDQLSSTDVWT